MRHWTPPPIPPPGGPIRKPWEIAVDVVGGLLLLTMVIGIVGVATGAIGP